MLAEALHYADVGWRVLPVHGITDDGHCTCRAGASCPSPGKHPAIPDWVNRATTDPDRIKTAWGHNARLNIGIATGAGSGVFVLDVDTKHGGFDSLERMQVDHGRLPPTLTAITGSGGRHFLFQHVPGLGNKGGFLPGLDIRGDGGQFVAAPSRHWSGGVYHWDDDAPVEVAAAPEWLVGLLAPEIGRRVAGAHADKWVAMWRDGVGEGERNVAVAAMTGHLLKRGLDALLVYEMIHTFNASKVNPPLTDAEVLQTINSVAAKELSRRVKRHG